MMNSILFGQSLINWAWTTPVWLFSVGITVGLIGCLLIILLGYGLSFVPGLNTLNENPRKRLYFTVGLTILTNLVLIPFFWSPAYTDWLSAGHHLGAFQPYSDIKQSADNPPGFSAMVLAILLMSGSMMIGFLTFFALCSRKIMSEIGVICSEGPNNWLLWIGVKYVFIAVAGIALAQMGGLGTNLFIVEKPLEILKPASELFTTGVSRVQKIRIEPGSDVGQEVPIAFNGTQLRGIEVWSDQSVEIQSTPFREQTLEEIRIQSANLKIAPETPTRILRQAIRQEIIPYTTVSKLFVKNDSSEAATLEIRVITTPTVPQLDILPFCAASVLGLFLFYIFMRGVMPKVAAVALSTFKTEVSQPVYLILLVTAIVGVLLFVILPYNTFGEDIKMLKDAGLTLILVFSIFLAIWAASKSIAEEIEGRTALTVLSKPIGRRQFIVGKFMGIAWALAIFAIIVGIVFFVPAVSFKTIYDAKEGSADGPQWQDCYAETVKIVPGILLGFMETLVFIAISVTISTRMPIMANILICFAIYVLGHLTPLIVQSTVAVGAFETVVFFGQLIATIFPVLDHFNIQAAISGDAIVPMSYLGWSLIYCTIYGGIALLLGLIFFEDRDVA